MSAVTPTVSGTAFHRVCDALVAHGSKRQGQKYQCPAHNDPTPSLSVSQGRQRVLLHCFAGCKPEAIVFALGLTMADLFDAPRSMERSAPSGMPPKTTRAPATVQPIPKQVAAYVYESAGGDLLRRKIRREPGRDGAAKEFSWQTPDGNGGWIRSDKGDGNPHVLYAMPLVSECGVIHINEGEKAADCLNDYFAENGIKDHAATCAPSSNWEKLYTDELRGKRIILWVDRDEPGEKLATVIADSLGNAGIEYEAVRALGCGDKTDAFDHIAAGHAPDKGEPFDLRAVSDEESETSEAERQRKTWPLLWIEDADGNRSSDYIVDDTIHSGTVGAIFGKSGTLKTMLILDIMAHVARGVSWRDHKTRARGAVYVAAEGGGGIEGRIAALGLQYPGIPKHGIVVVKHRVDLRNKEEVEDFAYQLESQVLPEMPSNVGLIAFDTMSQSMPGGEENTGADITLVESNVRDLIGKLGQAQGDDLPAVCLVAHPGKDPTKGIRGHSSQNGNFDWLIETQREGSGDVPLELRVFTARTVKVKDGPDNARWAYGCDLVEVGVREEDGKVHRAPVIREVNSVELQQAGGNKKPYRPRDGSIAAGIISAMNEVRKREGTQHVPEKVLEKSGYQAELDEQGDAPSDVDGVLRKDVAEYMNEVGGYTLGSTGSIEREQYTSARTQRNGEIRRLVDRRVIRTFGDWMWWVN